MTVLKRQLEEDHPSFVIEWRKSSNQHETFPVTIPLGIGVSSCKSRDS